MRTTSNEIQMFEKNPDEFLLLSLDTCDKQVNILIYMNIEL